MATGSSAAALPDVIQIPPSAEQPYACHSSPYSWTSTNSPITPLSQHESSDRRYLALAGVVAENVTHVRLRMSSGADIDAAIASGSFGAIVGNERDSGLDHVKAFTLTLEGGLSATCTVPSPIVVIEPSCRLT